MDIAVEEDKLSLAIGRGGQNIRLASQLTGWELNVMSTQEAEAKTEAEQAKIKALFTENLDVDEEIANILVQEGFSSIEELAYVPTAELLQVAEFDETMVEELRSRARDVLLTQAIQTEEDIESADPAADLLSLEGMDPALAHVLAAKGIRTREDLADQAVDDLLEVEGMDADRAAKLIMAARAHWFAEADAAE